MLVKELRLFDHGYVFRNFRMCFTTYELLLSWDAPFIKKSDFRRPTANPAERLCLTMRYLATGDAQLTIATSYRISPTTVGRIIRETCQVLCDILSEKGYLVVPKTNV